MIALPQPAALEHDAAGAHHAQLFIALERGGEIAFGNIDHCGKRDAVLDGHAGSLRECLQRRMRGVAQHGDAALAPVPHRVAVGDRPAALQIHFLEKRLHHRMRGLIGALDFRCIEGAVALVAMGVGAEHGNDVEQGIVAQRVVHHVEAGPDPERRDVALRAGRHLADRHNGAMRDIADRFRLPIVDDAGAHQRAQAVGADQSDAVDLAAVFRRQCDAVVALRVVDDRGRRLQSDRAGGAAGVQQNFVQVDAMDDDVRRAEAGAQLRIVGDMRDLGAGERVEHHAGARQDRLRQQRLDQAEAREHRKHVGPELNAVADGAEFGRGFKDAYAPALPAERQSRGQTAEAAADDQDCVRVRHWRFRSV